MNPPKKLTSQQQQQEQTTSEQVTRSDMPLEFAHPEELLRHDALHTPVPPSIAHRLQNSIQQEVPPPKSPWWRRLFQGGDKG